MPPKGNAKAKASSKWTTKGGPATTGTASEAVIAPQWPALKPLVPVSDLFLEIVLEGQITVIRKFFTSSLCQPKKGEAVRVNDRFQIDDPVFARALWEATSLKDLVMQNENDWGGKPCGLNPNIRVYRYRPGQFFDQHYDESNLVTIPGDPITMARTTWTLLIYLTGPATGCMGGETVFYPEGGNAKGANKKGSAGLEPISVAPEVGLALLHKHGDDCLLHEGKLVTGGEKWIIRSDLCVLR